ncbi:MAG TPA: bifunctional demethylmenaquinone methyltransferase/2-methoxy-6-polyprenyl-1,4-benzoquinol methylase UbiE [Flavobacteriales bacterium]|nr:bifunctional demethylmenaquinone methyltransferase/2-methoxy-6-polyprenyl-1,4-benzoquinol methylase UbiE [Flavobacteriales bacterium]HIK67059.1 bifunctional demethylmenaquinone methyltransferase/2-methoxy-6-polyprenyl-1,4-benzoquinol methylase UbiE [Flavobacteriales bacterium]
MGRKVTPYTAVSEETKKKQVERMFDSIAPKYDFLNHFFSMGIDVLWRKKCIRILKRETRTPRTILDMATGTGDFAIEAVRMGLPSQMTAMDLSQGMLDVGIKKVAAKGLTDRITLIQGDSENLPFKDETFDAYTVAFGVRNFEDLDRGLSEMYRVLTPGSLTVILEFSNPKSFPIKQLFGFYFKHVMPVLGRLISKDPAAYTYLPESVKAFPEGAEFLERLKTARFIDLRAIPLTGGIASIYLGRKPGAEK